MTILSIESVKCYIHFTETSRGGDEKEHEKEKRKRRGERRRGGAGRGGARKRYEERGEGSGEERGEGSGERGIRSHLGSSHRLQLLLLRSSPPALAFGHCRNFPLPNQLRRSDVAMVDVCARPRLRPMQSGGRDCRLRPWQGGCSHDKPLLPCFSAAGQRHCGECGDALPNRACFWALGWPAKSVCSFIWFLLKTGVFRLWPAPGASGGVPKPCVLSYASVNNGRFPALAWPRGFWALGWPAKSFCSFICILLKTDVFRPWPGPGASGPSGGLPNPCVRSSAFCSTRMFSALACPRGFWALGWPAKSVCSFIWFLLKTDFPARGLQPRISLCQAHQ